MFGQLKKDAVWQEKWMKPNGLYKFGINITLATGDEDKVIYYSKGIQKQKICSKVNKERNNFYFTPCFIFYF